MARYEPGQLIWAKPHHHGSEEVPAVVVKIEGKDVFYRPAQTDGVLRKMTSVHEDSPRIRPARSDELALRIDRIKHFAGAHYKKWEVSIPNPEVKGQFVSYACALPSRAEALRIAQKDWGADSQGRILIVNEYEV